MDQDQLQQSQNLPYYGRETLYKSYKEDEEIFFMDGNLSKRMDDLIKNLENKIVNLKRRGICK